MARPRKKAIITFKVRLSPSYPPVIPSPGDEYELEDEVELEEDMI